MSDTDFSVFFGKNKISDTEFTDSREKPLSLITLLNVVRLLGLEPRTR